MTPISAAARATERMSDRMSADEFRPDQSAYADQATDFIRRNPGLAKEVARQINARTVARGLTARQRECLTFVRSFIAENGHSPSFDQIMDALDLASKSSVHRLVSALEARGHINRQYGGARSISLRSVL